MCAAEIVGALRHRARIAVERGLVAEDLFEHGGVHHRDRARVELGHPEPLLQQERRPERPLHRDLLVEQHPEQHRERLGGEELVGRGDGGEVQRSRVAQPWPQTTYSETGSPALRPPD